MIDEAKRQLILDYQSTYGTDSGKRVYEHLSQIFNFESEFDSAVCTGNMYKVALEIGKREAFLKIRNIMKADPDQELQENTINE